ncbi:MAG TPA: S1C family serine protease [Patescibacteria group bacterium]|nr:S1C family serine protease [Patescibacteria group bacterium]
MKKFTRIIFIIIGIFFVGGFGAVVTDRLVFPKLATYPAFSKFGFLKRAIENVTVVNKTENIVVKEDTSIDTVASQAATTVVNIISLPENQGVQTKTGSGVIVTSDGLIVTDRSALISDSARYHILIFDGREFDATLVGVDVFSNLAFLRSDAVNLSAISFANSDDARAGKKLIAIGNSAEDYQNRFASGLLSNINKTANLSGGVAHSSEKLEGVFEIDFNNLDDYVGGPVIDFNGELQGIVSSVVINGTDVHVLIPANRVREALQRVIENVSTLRPILGVSYISITKTYVATYSETARDHGALIYSPSGRRSLAIIAGSPADRAGLQVGDIVIFVNDKEVTVEKPLSNLIAEHKKGDKITLKVLRSGNEIDLSVQL